MPLGPGMHLPTAPAAVALFLVGQIIFVARYKGGAAARYFGFAVTFYPTAALTLGSLCLPPLEHFQPCTVPNCTLYVAVNTDYPFGSGASKFMC